jgi:hypothetical protein
MRPLKNILLIISLCLPLLSAATPINRINHNGQDIFLNGMNLAWISFAGDVVGLDITRFSKALDSISNGGGNTIRWWLHTNGTSSPTFKGDSVSGITATMISNMKKGLDSAYVRGMGIVMCLWSFDMLQSGLSSTTLNRNTLMLTDSIYTDKYIRNALNPMLDAIGSHPAVICWEVFNEPEGMSTQFGWTPNRVNMSAIQQFTNLVTGAIHRRIPSAKVSNGSWCLQASTDVGATNYYRDDRLIAAGGDSLGTLDFYMVHYYDPNNPSNFSPFLYPASHWGLDKPIVIGEFSAHGPTTGIGPNQAYNYLYDNGYAGGFTWTWTGHDGNGNVKDATEGMLDLYNKHPVDIVITYPSVEVNYIPTIVDNIDNISFPKGASTLNSFLDAKDYFLDVEDGTALTYTLAENSNTELVSATLSAEGIMDLAINDVEGFSKITINATDKGGRNGSLSFYIAAYDTNLDNKAVNREVFASSSYRPAYPPEYAVDSNSTTYWKSESDQAEWIAVKFEKPYNIEGIKLNWGSAYAREYEMQVSDNGTDWTTVYSQTNGKAGVHVFDIEPNIITTYLKMNGIKRNTTGTGYALKEFEAYEYGFINGISSFDFNDKTINIYPVPSVNELSIQTSSDIQIRQVKILNEAGQFIESRSFNATDNNNTVNISGLQHGTYFLFIYTNDNVVLKKFIKQ